MTEKLKENKLLIGAVVALVLVFGLLSVGDVRAQISSWEFNVFTGVFKSDNIDDLKTLLDVTGEDVVLGALVGNELNSPEWNVNGVIHAYRSQGWATATNTPCILRTPGATSTLEHASALSNAVTSTGYMELYVSPTFATDTDAVLISHWLTAEGQGFENIASSTSAVASSTGLKIVISPNSNFIFDYSGATSSLSADTSGTCKAEFLLL